MTTSHMSAERKVRGLLLANEPMARHSSWRCGGPARRYFEPDDREDLLSFVIAQQLTREVLWVGLGSNLLVRDGGLDETVVATPRLNSMRWETPELLYAECGVPCARLAREAAAKDRGGLEFLAGIPGTVGGALTMNAGALGSETWEFIESVDMLDEAGSQVTLLASDFSACYRGVRGAVGWFLGARFKLPVSAGGHGPARIREVRAQRSATQPTGQASCGSVFKNPPGDFAGRLIELSGLKGTRCGGCKVSERHANFIVNDCAATAADIETLINQIIDAVREKTGITLETEVRIVGNYRSDDPENPA